MDRKSVNGTIIKGIGGFYYVMTADGVVECKAGGRLRLVDGGTPMVGDQVCIELEKDDTGFVVDIAPRRNSLVRPPVSNVDLLFIVASEAPPVTDPYLIDKVTVIARQQGIDPVILLNKSDLADNGALFSAYRLAGFPVYRVSAETGEDCGKVSALLRGRVSCFTGNSGVGKSSLLNRLAGLSLATGGISGKIGRGKHTTRHVELIPLPDGGMVADTPGFSSFDITQMQRIQKDELQHLFPEMQPLFGQCRFTGCSHICEPDCAVRRLLLQGGIAPSRYDSYARLYDELKQIKSWQ